MALNRTLAWEVLREFCQISRLVEVTHLMEIPYPRKYRVSWSATCGKNVSTKEFSKLHTKFSVVSHVSTRVKMKL